MPGGAGTLTTVQVSVPPETVQFGLPPVVVSVATNGLGVTHDSGAALLTVLTVILIELELGDTYWGLRAADDGDPTLTGNDDLQRGLLQRRVARDRCRDGTDAAATAAAAGEEEERRDCERARVHGRKRLRKNTISPEPRKRRR